MTSPVGPLSSRTCSYQPDPNELQNILQTQSHPNKPRGTTNNLLAGLERAKATFEESVLTKLRDKV